MSYASIEGSVQSGQPVEAYLFEIAGTEYRYTSAEDVVTVNSQDYQPLALSPDQLAQASDDRDGLIDIQVPGVNEFARLYIDVIPRRSATLRVYRFHRTDTPTPQAVVYFDGYVQSVEFTRDGRFAAIAAKPRIAIAQRQMQRIMFQGGCNHELYDSLCGVDDEDPTFVAAGLTITAVSSDGRTITVPGLAAGYDAGWFTGGFVEVVSPNDLRLVLEQDGDDLLMLFPFHESALGETVNVVSGCAHDVSDCSSKFFNFENYGGDPYIPTVNPHTAGIG